MRISPAVRISLGLVLMTMSFLLIADLLNLLPNNHAATLDARKKVCESLAIQFTADIQRGDLASVQATIENLAVRNTDIHSIGLRKANGDLLASTDSHVATWSRFEDHTSTATQVQVPIMQGDAVWATVEVSFEPLTRQGILGFLDNPLTQLIAFVAFSGFLGYLFFMKRALRELDPSRVVPGRVKAAMNALSEGVIIMDDHENILLANAAFMDKTRLGASSIIGLRTSSMPWVKVESQQDQPLPWLRTLQTGENVTGVPLSLDIGADKPVSFAVNSASIMDDKGNRRGALVTFDDVTQLHEKNEKLQEMLTLLMDAQNKIEIKNQELEVLATHDPLTGTLNRRALYTEFKRLFAGKRTNANGISVIMVDIDFFKSVNDRYGHTVGDEVIKAVVSNIRECLRAEDSLGRYGGEEFCILLPETGAEEATIIAERIRDNVERQHCSIGGSTFSIKVTISLGVSSVEWGAKKPGELLDQADKALYAAKRQGRNRVIRWADEGVANTLEHGLDESGINHVPVTTDSGSTTPNPRPVRLDRTQSATATGSPNRSQFLRLLSQATEHAVREGKTIALILLDLDMFKRINETFGHAAGDQLLTEATLRLGTVLRGTDFISRIGSDDGAAISRLGGDEFGIMISNLANNDDLLDIVNRINEALSTKFCIKGHDIYVTASIGISLCPQHSDSAQALFRDADIAMYQAKRDGRNNFRFYSPEMKKASFQQMHLESLLHEAVTKEEFLLQYQPCIDTKTGRITRFEALMRWAQPQHGIINPNDFIPIAEYTGLIVPMGEWLLRTACKQAKAWVDAGHKDLRVAVNLSPKQFNQKDFAQQIMDILNETGLAPRHLDLEITEGTIMENVESASETMRILHEHGIAISIDDFGTGYSSLNYLKNFSIDALKIDREFIMRATTDPRDLAIVHAIVAMGHAMQLRVVAEGVETSEQLEILKNMHCDEVQGYYFSPPVAEKNATELLNAHNAAEAHAPKRHIGAI